MRVVAKLLVVVLIIAFVRSNRNSKNDKPAPPIEPSAVIENNGAEHRLYRGVKLLDVVETLPTSAIDTLDADTRSKQHLIVVIKVPLGNNKVSDLHTTFKLKNGQSFVRKWLPVNDNKNEIATGVFAVIDSVVSCSTEIKPSARK